MSSSLHLAFLLFAEFTKIFELSQPCKYVSWPSHLTSVMILGLTIRVQNVGQCAICPELHLAGSAVLSLQKLMMLIILSKSYKEMGS